MPNPPSGPGGSFDSFPALYSLGRFGQLVMAQRLDAPGVILVRLHPIRGHLEGIVAAVREHAAEIPGSFVVISRGRVRVRPLPARGEGD